MTGSGIGELPAIPPPIGGASTAVTAFIDYLGAGPTGVPTPISSFFEFEQIFGGLNPGSEAGYQIQQFFLNGGGSAVVLGLAAEASATLLTSALASLSVPFNLLCLPATSRLAAADMHDVMLEAQSFCAAQRGFYIADIPPTAVVASPGAMATWFAGSALDGLDNAAIYYPRLTVPDPLDHNAPREIGYSGTVAGIYARTDETRGVWKAPAGGGAALASAMPVLSVSDVNNAQLNALGINAIRIFPREGAVLWGARTTAGATGSNSDFPYVNVRRFALYIERSLFAGLAWVVFEPNNQVLWSAITNAVSSFMLQLWRQGALPASKPQEAFFVRCDATTTTQTDIDNGMVHLQIGFAPIRPAEFLIIMITLAVGPTS
jgi:phage tail sheath protein FI